MPLAAAKLFGYEKVNMNHTGSLTLAWPQCRAENNNRKEGRKGGWGGWGIGTERETHLKSLHRC